MQRPIDYQKILDKEKRALIAGGDIANATVAAGGSSKIPQTVQDCCGKGLLQCRCVSTSSAPDRDDYIFTGSTYNLEEFAVSKHVMQLASNRNILSIFFTDISHAGVAVEYERFIEFIRDHSEPGKSQLAPLIFPVTIHLYALMMQDDDIGLIGARRFLNVNARFLWRVRSYRENLDALIEFKDIEELKQDSRFQHYMERKIVIKISKNTFQSLQNFLRFLKDILNQTILLSVLSFNIDFQDCDLCDCPVEEYVNEVIESSDVDESKINETDVKGKKGASKKNETGVKGKKGESKKNETGVKGKKGESKKNETAAKGKRGASKKNETGVKGKKGESKIKETDVKGKKGECKKNETIVKGRKGKWQKNEADIESEKDECKKNETTVEVGKELKHKDPDPDLKNIEISQIVLRPKRTGNALSVYDHDTEEAVGMDKEDIVHYTDPKKKPKRIDVKPVRLRNLCRNVPIRYFEVKPRARKKVKIVEPKPKKVKGVRKIYSERSIHSVDFNCSMTEISYATGDEFIYTISVAVPEKKKKKTINFIKDTTVILRTLEYKESDLKSTIDPEEENIFVVKYLPEDPNSLLAACGLKVRLFDTKTCSFLVDYIIDDSFVYTIDIDSTGQYFAAASQHTAAYIYTFDYTDRFGMLTGHEKSVTAVKFHPNGIYIATGSEDCTLRLFEVESGQCVRLFVGHLFSVSVMDFSYDGNLIAAADSSGMVMVWDIKDCAMISKMAMRMRGEMCDIVYSLCFHEKSFALVACNEKGEVMFWDAKNPEHKHVIRSLKQPIKITRQKGKGWNIAYLSYDPKDVFAKKIPKLTV